jgi:hypothetical protein
MLVYSSATYWSSGKQLSGTLETINAGSLLTPQLCGDELLNLYIIIWYLYISDASRAFFLCSVSTKLWQR